MSAVADWRDTRDGKRIAGHVKVVGGCWEWTGYRIHNGYGLTWLSGRKMLAHRAAYTLAVGAIPAGRVLDHLCRNRACIRPDHLEAVTIRTNTMRGDTIPARHAARTHCLRGHQYTPDNTTTRAGYRRCRTCLREHVRAQRARKALAKARL